MKKIMFMFAATLMMAACSNEDIATNDVQYVSELKIGFEGANDSRVVPSHSAAGLKFAWEDGEEIKIYKKGSDYGFAYEYVYDRASNSFKPERESYQMEVGQEYFAVTKTKTSIPVEEVEGKIVVKTELKSYYGLEDIPMITDVFTATAEGTVATMHHLVGVVEVPVVLNSESEYNKALNFGLYVSGGKLSGSFTATPVAPYVYSTDDAYDTMWKKEEETTLSTESATSIFIPVLPGTYVNPKVHCFYSTSGESAATGSISLSGTLTVTRGKIIKIPEQSFKLW